VRTRRVLSRQLGMAEGLGFKPNWRGVRGDHARVRRARAGLLERDDMWGSSVGDWERKKGNGSGRGRSGPWAAFGHGLDSVPGAFLSPFLFSLFSFLFSFDFLI
jgi:hypothetical protein